MPLKTKINDDLKDALKKGEKDKISALRLLLAQIHNQEIEKKGKKGESELDEDEVVALLQRELKKRKESVELFRKGQREDLAEREEKEAALITLYLPKQASQEEIEKAVDEAIRGGMNDFGSVMKEVMQRLKGRADGKAVSSTVKEKLGSS
ncbi:MAG: GatB/YqeY domain-containing protein [Candidatus Liptonbacteria bacterium]|nr:GatB/YqeY domain-containing protein [Candidatus Liptonbacteria bacterium]